MTQIHVQLTVIVYAELLFIVRKETTFSEKDGIRYGFKFDIFKFISFDYFDNFKQKTKALMILQISIKNVIALRILLTII